MDYKLKDYDKVLSELIEALSKQKINLSSSNADGRVNSINNEKELTNLILNVIDLENQNIKEFFIYEQQYK